MFYVNLWITKKNWFMVRTRNKNILTLTLETRKAMVKAKQIFRGIITSFICQLVGGHTSLAWNYKLTLPWALLFM